MLGEGRLRAFSGYVLAVAFLGIACVVGLVAVWGGFRANSFGWLFLLLAPYVLVGELYPLRVPRGREEGQITVSTTFAFAILLSLGAVPAVLALACSSLVADLHARKLLRIALFNAAQMILSLMTSAAVLMALGAARSFGAPIDLDTFTLPAVLVAAVAFFAVNVSLVIIGFGARAYDARDASTRATVGEFFRREMSFHALTAAVLFSLSPIVAAAAERSLALIPLFAVPMLAVYASVSIYLDREHEVLHDALTGLPNRTLFRDRVQQAIDGATRREGAAAVMMLDLDNFKEVNDTLGHETGDGLLVEVAERLRTTVEGADTVARLGGDEFAVVVWDAGELPALLGAARAVRSVIEQPFVVEGVTLALEASVGLARCPEHGATAHELMRSADTAMHVAKRQRSGYRLYVPEDAGRVGRRMRLIAALRSAIEQDQFELHYQPKAELRTGKVAGVEALIRWRQDGRLVPPDEFIPVAEQTGLMGSLTRYVVRAALAQASAWHRNGIAMPVAVNISARDLQDRRLPEDILGMLEDARFEARWLELEITENSIMGDVEEAIRVLSRLRSMGVSLAIDDFGTGNTSLAHLPRLPVHVLKIDKSFVGNLEAADDDPIVRTTVELGRSLGLQVVAEGVSSERIWHHLEGLGCDLAQGYHLSPPVPAPQLEAWLRGRRFQRSPAGPVLPQR